MAQQVKNQDGTYTLYDPSSYTPSAPSSIAISSLSSPQSPTPFVQPKETPVPNVTALTAGLSGTQNTNQLTTSEQQVSDYQKQVMDLTNALVGQSDYKQEQSKAAGVETLQTNLSDLQKQMLALQNEAAAIPQQLQQDATGKGVTAGGLQPIQTAALRNNAIASLAKGAQIAAAQGSLAHALDLVDRAVASKFDPIKERLNATTQNLQLILSSPQYNEDTKRRAQNELDQRNAEKAKVLQAEAAQKDIWDLAMKASANGADAAIVQAIQHAASPDEALSIATQYGAIVAPQKANIQQVKLDDGTIALVDMNTGKTVRTLGGGGNAGGVAGVPGITTQPAYSKLTDKQKIQADAAQNILGALQGYKNIYSQLVKSSGSNIAGADSAQLESAYNALIFQVAQAVGTGALQQADREVIQKIIPDPTTFLGAPGRWLKGGKTGGLEKIDSQIAQFENQLKNYGIEPAEGTSTSTNSNDPLGIL